MASVLIELALIWIVVLVVVKFLQGTRAAGAIKAVLVVLLVATMVVQIIGGEATLPRLVLLYDRLLAVVVIGLVVIFQPELRRALIRLGETPLLRSNTDTIGQIVDPIVEAAAYFSKARFGAIIVIERRVGLAGLVEGGTRMDAELSAAVLQTIFFPGTALHDLAVVIRGKVIHAAGVQLPMADAEEMSDPSFGARHRAAVGLTKETDALVLVVSEESGAIRLVERGKLGPPLSPDELRAALRERAATLKANPAKEATAGKKQEQAEQLPDVDPDEPDAPAEPSDEAPAPTEASAKGADS